MESKKFIIDTKKFKGESTVISLRLSNKLIEKYEEISIKTGRSRNELITLALEFAIDNLEIK